MTSLPKPYYHDEHAGIVVYHGDAQELLPLLAAQSADLILTDPPYGCDNNGQDLRTKYINGGIRPKVFAGPQNGRIANDLDSSTYRFLLTEAKRLLAANAACCCFCGGGGPIPRFAEWTMLMQETLGFKMCVIWDKVRPGIGWHYRRTWECVLVSETTKWNGGMNTQNIIHMPGLSYSKNMHPTQKPIELMKLFIHLHSNPGELVLDPFAGSLTTLVAAKQLGRRAIGIEIDERWLEIGIERLRQQQLCQVQPIEQFTIELPEQIEQPKRELAHLQDLRDNGHPDKSGLELGMSDWLFQDAIETAGKPEEGKAECKQG